MGRTIAAIAERTADLGRILEVVGSAVGLVVEHLDREARHPQERRGGYICLAEDAPKAPVILHARIGLVRAEKVDKYHEFSREKAVRLASRPGDVSSWQTRDEAHDQYGGAIRAWGTLFSFSGLPELADEAAMLLVALKLGVLTAAEAEAIARVSNNRTFEGIEAQFLNAGTWDHGIWTVPQE